MLSLQRLHVTHAANAGESGRAQVAAAGLGPAWTGGFVWLFSGLPLGNTDPMSHLELNQLHPRIVHSVQGAASVQVSTSLQLCTVPNHGENQIQEVP